MAQLSQISNEGETSHRGWPPQSVGRQIQKVAELLLKEEQNYQDYIPKVVSLGPYHHGKPELRLAESVKPMTLDMVVSGDNETIGLYHQEIKNEINNIRNCYERQFTCLYSDDELVRMMLFDASFIIIHIESSMPPLRESDQMMLSEFSFFMFQTLGMLTMSTAFRDMLLLENQIPFWIVKLLLSSRYNEDEIQELFDRYFTMFLYGEFGPKRSLPPLDEEDLHLLEAFHRILCFDCVSQPQKTGLSFIGRFCSCFRAKEKTIDDPTTDPESNEPNPGKSRFQSCLNELKARACRRLIENKDEGDRAKVDVKIFMHSFRSVTDLKAKGIHFKPSQTQSLKDVQFESNFSYGKLQIPHWCVAINTKAFFLNMIAYEFNPNNPSRGVVTSYINLMKSLIVRPEDVKELREKKILFCILGNDEQVLKMYQDINTYGANNPRMYQDVKDRIQAHYNSKSKTWIAELIHTYFRSPWTVITLFAATCLLVLTIIQTIYASKS